jgi:hypothetical protein
MGKGYESSKEDYLKGVNLSNIISSVGSKKFNDNRHTSADASFHDRKRMQDFLNSYAGNLGEAHIIVNRKGSNGQASTEPYYDGEIGDFVVPDAKGDVRILNEDFMNTVLEAELEIERKVDRIMEYCVASETLCKLALGLDDGTYVKLLGPNSKIDELNNDYADEYKMSTEMGTIDGRISFIRSLPAKSPTQTQALSKLRLVCRWLRHRFNMKNLHKRPVQDTKNHEESHVDANGITKGGVIAAGAK